MSVQQDVVRQGRASVFFGRMFLCLPWLLMPAFANEAGIDVDMGAHVFLLVFFVGMSISVSFICSIAEACLLSMTPSYISTLEHDPRLAARLKSVKIDNIDRSIAAILTLNTVAHTLGSLGAGAQATIVFGNAWFGVFSAVMTLVILIGTEIIPKTLGTAYWREVARPVSYYVTFINVLLAPILWLTDKVTRLLTKGHAGHSFSRHEFLALATEGEAQGQMNALESKIIKNLMALGAISAEDILTPRSVMVAFDASLLVDEVAQDVPRFSRFPIYESDIDNITGFVLKSEILMVAQKGQGARPLKEFMRPISFMFGKMKGLDLLDAMLKERLHIAIIVGEYGEVRGLVSLEDVLETLLGLEIVDEQDAVDDMQTLAKQLHKKRLKRLGIDEETT